MRLQDEGDSGTYPISVNPLPLPMYSDYIPELDASTELESYVITMYQEQIGELIRTIETRRVDIRHEVSVLYSCQSAPRDCHLQQIWHVFAFLKQNPKLTLYLDPNPEIIYQTSFKGSTAEEVF